MHLMENTLTPDPITGAFAPKICDFCSELPTQHRCLATITTGGVLYGVAGGRICGHTVCSLCSFKFGNEGVLSGAIFTPVPVLVKKILMMKTVQLHQSQVLKKRGFNPSIKVDAISMPSA
jgi:hypothetical protein